MSDIAKNDLYINNLKELIEDRKKLLTDKFKEISKNIDDNERLSDVFVDNLPLYDNIIREKHNLIEAFNNISDYLDTIIHNKSIPKNKRQEAYREKKDIINIIKIQKKELKSLV
jgi:hypothetical protein